MYNKEITTLINENFKMDHKVVGLINSYKETLNAKYLDQAIKIQSLISKNHVRINVLNMMGGENQHEKAFDHKTGRRDNQAAQGLLYRKRNDDNRPDHRVY